MTLAHLPHPNYPAAVEPPALTANDNKWIALIQPAADLANMIAGTDFVPAEMRNSPGAIAACILYGAELGLGPMVSLAKIDLVKGRPAPKAELARALALAAGHEVWVDEQTNTKCRVSGKRRGSQKVETVTWTMDDVKRAGISSHMYTKYPRQMLLARASTELVRMMCPDALGGITLFAEELEDGDVEAVAPAVVASEPLKQTRKRNAAPTPPSVPQGAGAPDLMPVDDSPPPLPDELPPSVTDAQIKKMMAQFNDIGLKERNDRLDFIAAAVRRVDSSKDLTVDEASKVIDALDKCISGGASLVVVDGGMQLHLDEEPF